MHNKSNREPPNFFLKSVNKHTYTIIHGKKAQNAWATKSPWMVCNIIIIIKLKLILVQYIPNYNIIFPN